MILPSKKVAGKDFIRPVFNFFILPSAFVAGHREVFFQSRINDFAGNSMIIYSSASCIFVALLYLPKRLKVSIFAGASEASTFLRLLATG
jgi:hypothetical protein